MTTRLRRTLWVLFLVFFAAHAAFAQDRLRVMLKAPKGGLNADAQGTSTALFEHLVAIPYGTLEGQIGSAIKNLVNTHGDATGHVSKSGIDYDWKIDSTGSFSFTQPNQPVLTVLSSSQNKVRVQLNATARAIFKADLEATTDDHIPVPPFLEYPDFDGSIKVHADFTIVAKADVTLWPAVKVENVETSLSSTNPHVEVKDLSGDMTGFAIGVGSAVGFSPGGLLLGGPAAFSLVGLIGSNAAYDHALDLLDDKLAAGLEAAVKKADAQLESQLMKYIAPAVAGVNQVKTKALNTTIPGYGGSLNQLQSQAGMSLDVRTRQESGITVWATVRFDGEGRNGKVTGTVQFPKARCRKSGGSVAGVTIVHGFFEPTNTDLSNGMSCASLLQASGMQVRAYLGATPPGTSLPTWKTASSGLKGLGTVKDVTTGQPGLASSAGYFECRYEMTGLPNGLLSFTAQGPLAARLHDYVVEDERRLVFGTSGSLDAGGAGKCEGIGMSGGLTPNKGKLLRDKLACPHCPQVQLQRGEDVIRPGMMEKPGRATPALDRVRGQAEELQPASTREVMIRSPKGAKIEGTLPATGGYGGPDTQGATSSTQGALGAPAGQRAIKELVEPSNAATRIGH